ncbi:hypothetical protein BGZ73_008467 [Actinomortierella ambigua]|nr:hypothetical protein BGZ73_008467 [Actinomortierella ambigua]
MSKRPAGRTEEAPSAQKAKADKDNSIDVQDERSSTLWTHLVMRLFEDRPARHEARAAQYIANMCQFSSPKPTVDGYLEYISKTYPSAPRSGVARSWNKLKEYFSSVENANLTDIHGLINVDSLTAAFTAAPQIPETTSASTSIAPSSCPENVSAAASALPLPRTRSTRSKQTRASSSSNGSSSTTSRSSNGNANGILHLVDDERDRIHLKEVLVDRPTEKLPALSAPEKAFLMMYNLPPDNLRDLLATSGWRTIGSDLKEQPDEEFQELVHTCVFDLLTAYRHVGMEVPSYSTESWFNNILWHFLGVAMFCPRRLRYHPGEVHSAASGHRRNKVRPRDGRQYIGHKADGMVVTKLFRFELCAVEATSKNNEPNGTKALDDSRKLGKMIKDMHDKIRESSTTNVRDQLFTFGVRISALTLTLYTIRQRPGRFYQMCSESSASLPDMWTDENTMAVLGVLERVLAFRKAMVEMGRLIPQWVSVSVGGSDPGTHGDWHAATLTTPHLIPDDDQSPVETIPETALP